MAKLKNVQKVWAAEYGKPVTVGHNRTITRVKSDDKHDKFVCRLHGHAVATLQPIGAEPLCRVELSTCGYLTATTVAAMGDFMKAFGVTGSASRAGGELSTRVKTYVGAFVERKGDNQKFTAGRY